MPYADDTIRRIAEDAFLLAHNIKEGDLGEEIDSDDGELEIRAKREWRAMELVINLGERLCHLAAIDDPWVPTSIQDLVETPMVNRVKHRSGTSNI